MVREEVNGVTDIQEVGSVEERQILIKAGRGALILRQEVLLEHHR